MLRSKSARASLAHAQMVKTNVMTVTTTKTTWLTNPLKLTRKQALNEKMPGSVVDIGWL